MDRWHAHRILDVKAPTFAPAYVALFPVLAELAQAQGYALAVHGSVGRDFDLVAIPWTDEAGEPDALVRSLADRCHLIYGFFGTGIVGPERRPHGRMSWAMLFGAGAMIDISVMPKQ